MKVRINDKKTILYITYENDEEKRRLEEWKTKWENGKSGIFFGTPVEMKAEFIKGFKNE